MLFLGEFQGQYANIPMSVYDRKCVIILQAKRARCALNKEILDLLNEERVSGAHSGRGSLPRVFENTKMPFKNFLGSHM